MKENKISAVGPSLPCIILAWIHSMLLFGGLYAFFAEFLEVSGRQFWLYSSLGFLLILPAALSSLLLKKIRFLITYVVFGVAFSILLGVAEGMAVAGWFHYSQGLTIIFTAAVSSLMFFIHTAARITHGNMKNDFIAAHGDDALFELEVWEVPNILSAPSPVAFAWFGAIYVIGVFVKLPAFWHIIFYISLAEIFVYFAYRYLFAFTNFLRDNHKSANIPVSTIRRVHKTFFIIAFVLLTFFVLPAVLFNREPLSELKEPEISVDVEELPQVGQQMQEPMVMDMEAVLDEMGIEIKEAPVWVGIMVRIFVWTLVAIAGYVFVSGILRSIKDAILEFNVEDEDEIIFLDSEDTDALSSTALERNKNDSLLSINAQIRRRYKRTIKKATKGTPLRSSTPTELEAAAGLYGSAESVDSAGTLNPSGGFDLVGASRASTSRILALHEAYEKARYSKDGCTREDLNSIS